MKGKTSIILRNVETGQVRVYENENLITDALDKIININVAMNYALNSYVLPIANKALGGIMLFDGPLTEEAGNVHFPTEAHLVGYASQDTNTTDKYRGSYNAVESGKTMTGFISVWDFGTGQANGSIKAVARTSAHAGQNPLYYYNAQVAGHTANGTPLADRGWYPVRYDGNYVYMLKGDSTTHVMRMARVKVPMLRMGVADYSDVARSYEVVASWSTLVTNYTWYDSEAKKESDTDPHDQYVYADNPILYEDGRDGYLYCMAFGPTRSFHDYSYTASYFTIKYSDGSYDRSETSRISGAGNFYSGRSESGMYFAGRLYGHVHNGTLYRISSNRKIVYKIPLDNPASYTPIRVYSDEEDDYIENLGRIISHEGGVFVECYHYTATGYSHLNGMVYPDGAVLLPDLTYQGAAGGHGGSALYNDYCWSADDDLTVWGYYDDERITRMWSANYLGTVNNLAGEIVKTPAETMKIVYTLTDIDEEDDDIVSA